MNELRSWTRVAWRLLHYVPYKLGLIELPRLYDLYPESADVLGRILGWRKYLRVRGEEHCPRSGPVIIAGNHMKVDDAWIMFRAAYLASQGGLKPRFMMRDDMFLGSWLTKNWLWDVTDFAVMGGTYLVSRDHVSLAQLKPFVEMLTQDQCFIMYPGRTRSRSGLLIEYRDGMEEPAGVSFFIAQAQRRRPDLRIPVAPLTRTHNVVNNRSTLIFGEPLYLDPAADRIAQRALDLEVVARMGDLVEINAAHLLGGVIYLRCLHGRDPRMTTADLEAAVARARDSIRSRYIAPEAVSSLGQELQEALAHFEQSRVLTVKGAEVVCDRNAILSAPDRDKTYKAKNPVKFLANQVVHLPDVVEAIHGAALG